MSEKWTLRGVDEETRQLVVAEAERRGVSVADYLSELLLERAVMDELASRTPDEEPTLAEPIYAPPPAETPNFAVRHRIEALERRLGLSVGGLDSAVHALDSSLFGIAQRVDETEALANETAETLNGALHDLSGNLTALRKRLADAEDSAEAHIENTEAAQTATAIRFDTLENALGNTDAIARGAATSCAALAASQESLQDTIARDFNAFARDVDQRFVAGYADMSAASEAAVRHADDAVNHALQQLRALNESVEARLSETTSDIRARMQDAFGDAADRLAALAERVIDNERFTLRTTDQLRAQIADVEDGAQTAIEESAEQLRVAHRALASEVERQNDNTRLAVEGARHALSEEIADTRDTFTTALLGVRGELSDAVAEVRDANAAANQATRNELAADITLTRTELSGEIGEIRERQLGALARLKLVDAAVTNTIGDVTELRDQIERAVNHSAAEAREGLTAVLTAWNTRFDTLATQGAHTEEDLVHARETLQREITRVEACTFAALEKLAADIATGDAQLQQTIGAELAEVRDQASGALARLTLIDQALRGTPELEQRIQKLEIAAGNTETEQALAAVAAQVITLAQQLDAQRVDENIQQRIDDLRARLAQQESQASEAADRVHGVARMLGRVTAQNADATTQSEDRLHKLELALADLRLESISHAPATENPAFNQAQADAIAAVSLRVAAMEQRQYDAFESIRNDIALFIGANDRRLAELEQQDTPTAAINDLNTMIDSRLTALEVRDVAIDFEALRKRIDERLLYVEQRSVRALEQVSETVAVIEKRLLSGEQGVARSA